MSALAQHLQNQPIALETQKFKNLKIQENQEKLIEDLKTSTVSTNQTNCSNSQPKVINPYNQFYFAFSISNSPFC